MSTYRNSEKPAEIQIAPLPWWNRNSWIFARMLIGAVVLQGPITAGMMFDVCTPAHVGLCWAVAIVAIGVSTTVGALMVTK